MPFKLQVQPHSQREIFLPSLTTAAQNKQIQPTEHLTKEAKITEIWPTTELELPPSQENLKIPVC